MSDSRHVVCPHCQTTNRVRSGQLGSAPDCGTCHRPLFAGHSTALNEAAFERQIGRNEIPVLVLFRGGREVARQAGAMGAADIVRWVKAHES